MKLLVLTFVIISVNFKSSSAKFNFLEDCFPPNRDLSIAYTGDNVLEVLNSQAGAEVFLPTQTGLKLNINVFTEVLGECIKNKFENKQLGDMIDKKKRNLTRLFNILGDREISFDDIDDLLDVNVGLRAKRELIFPFDTLQNILKVLVIEPLQTAIDNFFNNFTESLFLYYMDPTNTTDVIQVFLMNSINIAIETSVKVLSSIKSEINTLLDYLGGSNNTTEDTETTRSLKLQNRSVNLQSRSFISNIFTQSIPSVNKTINAVIEYAKTVVTSLTKETTNNPVDNIVNSIYNSFVTKIVEVINNIQSQIISYFDDLLEAINDE